MILSEKTTPSPKRTTLSQARRDNMQASSKGWCALDNAGREAWHAAAQRDGRSAKSIFWQATEWRDQTHDLIDWLSVCPDEESRIWTSVIWAHDAGLFVAVARTGEKRVAISGDGMHWQGITTPELNSWRDVCFAPSLMLFVAIASTGTHALMTSHDAINWTPRSASASGGWTAVAWSKELGIFVGVSYAGGAQVMTSPDGTNWTNRNIPSVSTWGVLVWADKLGLFVMLAGSGTFTLATSPDGVHWTGRTAGETSPWTSLAWSPSLLLLVAVTSGTEDQIWTSPDGTNWTPSSIPGGQTWNKITWSEQLKIFCLLPASGENIYATSPDGKTWTTQTAEMGGTHLAMCWSPWVASFVAMNASSTCLAALSPITLEPTKRDGTPLLTDRDNYPASSTQTAPTMRLSSPRLSEWSWSIAEEGPPVQLQITIPQAAHTQAPAVWERNPSGASVTILEVWAGQPVSQSRQSYDGPWKLAGKVLVGIGPWTTDRIQWPWRNPVSAGSCVPIRGKYISRGMRASPMTTQIVQIT